MPFLGSWCSSLPLSSRLWRLVFSAGVFASRCVLSIPRVCFLFVLGLSWPSCYLRCPALPFCLLPSPSSRRPYFFSPELAQLPGCFITPGSLCLAAMVCASRRARLIAFAAASFRLSWPCRFFFFGSTVSFCLVLSYFFLRWCVYFQGFLRLSSVVLLSPQFTCAIISFSLSVGFVVSASLSDLSFVCLVHLPLFVGWCFLFLVSSLCAFFLTSLWLFLYRDLASSLLFLGFLSVSGRSSASVESLVPATTGSSLWAESVVVWLLCALSSSLLFSIPVGRSLRLLHAASLLLLVQSGVLLSVGLFILWGFLPAPSCLWFSFWGSLSVPYSPFVDFP